MNIGLARPLTLALLIFSAVSAQSLDAATLRLTWKDTAINETGFQIQRWSGVAYVQVAQVGPNTQSYSDQTAAAGVRYCYRVRAVSSAGGSSFSNESCATAPKAAAPAPASPGGGVTTPKTPPAVPPPSSNNPSGGASAESWTDYRFKVKLRSDDNDMIGVIFRYVDDKNYYRFTWNQESPSRQIVRVKDGAATVLAGDTVPYRTGETYQVEVAVNGPAIAVAIDGQQVLSAADSSFPRGSVALYSAFNEGSVFEDVLVENIHSGSVLLQEDFSDSRFTGWTVMDETAQGGPSAWSVAGGRVVQQSNIGFFDNADPWRAPGTIALFSKRGWSDYRFKVKLRSDDNDMIGVIFRYVDDKNYYRFTWNQESPSRHIVRVKDGAATVLAGDAVPYRTGQTYQVEVAVNGPAIAVSIDGRQVLSAGDPSFPGGAVALYSSFNQGSVFEQVRVEDIHSGSLLLQDDFADARFTGWTVMDETVQGGPSAWSVNSGRLVQQSNVGFFDNADPWRAPGTIVVYAH
jgi:hypothetical protein